MQPEDLKISPSETFAHWLDTQWLRLTNNNDPSNPLVDVCYAREHKWVAVLDYILLRKIRSSLLLCKGIPPGVLTTEVAYEDLNWNTLGKVVIMVLNRLNQTPEDWPLWHYDGKLEKPEENINDENFRRESVKLIQSIKSFYEIYQSNLRAGLEAEWKQGINSISGEFPDKITPEAIVNHLDIYKTDFELAGLLETLGYEADRSYGMQYPQNVKPNAIVLINRPGHWVAEDNSSQSSRETVLDSLTAGTDAIHMGDTFNYFKPINDQKLFKKILPELAKLFPDIEVKIEDEGLTEFPPLVLPVTDHPAVTAMDYHESAKKAIESGDYKNALLDKRVECALLEQTDNILKLFDSLLEFTEWCLQNEKFQTAEENIAKLTELEKKLSSDSIPEIIGFHKLIAMVYSIKEQYDKAAKEYELALEIYSNDTFTHQKNEVYYELANGLGVTYARLKQFKKAQELFKTAKKYALKSLDEYADQFAEYELGPSIKYWPAIIKGLDNKIEELNAVPLDTNQKGAEKVI